ncbi:MAG: hypothetical protein HRU09_08590 [Oligoflexales bacterium]|nr:hypothetical protein [Oligoflexales bacterium]
MQFGDFFLVVPPGFSSLALAELQRKQEQIISLCQDLGICEEHSELQLSCDDEGISITGLPLELGFALNLFLKIPTRILLRLKSFRCRDFPKLFKQSQKVDWKSFIDDRLPHVKASASKSRLMMLKRIEKTVSDGIAKSFEQGKESSSSAEQDPTVHVRLFDDTCTLSIDTSGIALYKRHHGKKIGEAPIRETLAAGLLCKLMEYRSTILDASSQVLIDPMMGSGTFLLEARTFGIGSDRKNYAFFGFPCLKGKKEGFLKLGSSLLNVTMGISEYIGYDRSEKMLNVARENLGNFPEITLKQQDIFAELKHPAPESPILICNPPYGKRIGFKDDPGFFFNKLLKNIYDKWNPCLAGLIVPEDVFRNKVFKIPSQFKLLEAFKFTNGGVKVRFLILSRA